MPHVVLAEVLVSSGSAPEKFWFVAVTGNLAHAVQDLDPKQLQIALTGFLEKNTSLFVKVFAYPSAACSPLSPIPSLPMMTSNNYLKLACTAASFLH